MSEAFLVRVYGLSTYTESRTTLSRSVRRSQPGRAESRTGELPFPPPQTESREAKESDRHYGTGCQLPPIGFRTYIEKEQESNRPKRQIKEIRVFFDDGTYEAFVPSK